MMLIGLDHFTLFRLFLLEGAMLYLNRSRYCQPAVGNLASVALLSSAEGGSGLVQQLCQSGCGIGHAEVSGIEAPGKCLC